MWIRAAGIAHNNYLNAISLKYIEMQNVLKILSTKCNPQMNKNKGHTIFNDKSITFMFICCLCENINTMDMVENKVRNSPPTALLFTIVLIKSSESASILDLRLGKINYSENLKLQTRAQNKTLFSSH